MFNPLSQSLVCTDEDFLTAKTIVNCLINHTAHVYTHLVKHDDTSVTACGKPMLERERQLFRALGGNFTREDYIKAAQKLNIPEKTAERYVGNFTGKYGNARRIRSGYYEKVK